MNCLSLEPLVFRIINGNAIIYSVNCLCDMQICVGIPKGIFLGLQTWGGGLLYNLMFGRLLFTIALLYLLLIYIQLFIYYVVNNFFVMECKI